MTLQDGASGQHRIVGAFMGLDLDRPDMLTITLLPERVPKELMLAVFRPRSSIKASGDRVITSSIN